MLSINIKPNITKTNKTKPFFSVLGCPGLDDYDYGVVNPASEWTSAWPFYRPQKSDPRHSFQASPAMRCGLTGNTDSNGVKLHEIIDEMAFDNENFAERFLEGWHQMTTNGYRQGFVFANFSCNPTFQIKNAMSNFHRLLSMFIL